MPKSLFRTASVRLKFNSYQNAYFTVLSKNYRFCLTLLTEWLYEYLKDKPKTDWDKIDYEFRRYGYRKALPDFPEELFVKIFKRLPTNIAQNIFPEAIALTKARIEKLQEEFHFRVNSKYFTVTDFKSYLNGNIVEIRRSRYLKKFFKDPIYLTIPKKVLKFLQNHQRFTFRIRWNKGTWWIDFMYPLPKKSFGEERIFAALDINMHNFCLIDEIYKEPLVLDFSQTIHKILKLSEKSSTLQSKGNPLYRKYLRKARQKLRSVLKLYAVRIIQYCSDIGINRLAVGKVTKRMLKGELSRKVRKVWNFNAISWFVEFLKSHGEKHGVYVYEISEEYTSQASALNQDFLPTRDYVEKNGKPEFSGQRINRGLYKTSDSTVIHADANGSANILRRAMNNLGKSIVFTKQQLSAVRKVGENLLHSYRLIICKLIQKLKDYSTAGYDKVVTVIKQSLPLSLLPRIPSWISIVFRESMVG